MLTLGEEKLVGAISENMNLKTYIKALRICPDENLKIDWGFMVIGPFF